MQDLQSLRKRITEQLTAAHSLMRDASPLLDPMDDERPAAAGAAAPTKPNAVPAGAPNAGGAVKSGVPAQRAQQPATAGGQKGRKG